MDRRGNRSYGRMDDNTPSPKQAGPSDEHASVVTLASIQLQLMGLMLASTTSQKKLRQLGNPGHAHPTVLDTILLHMVIDPSRPDEPRHGAAIVDTGAGNIGTHVRHHQTDDTDNDVSLHDCSSDSSDEV